MQLLPQPVIDWKPFRELTSGNLSWPSVSPRWIFHSSSIFLPFGLHSFWTFLSLCTILPSIFVTSIHPISLSLTIVYRVCVCFGGWGALTHRLGWSLPLLFPGHPWFLLLTHPALYCTYLFKCVFLNRLQAPQRRMWCPSYSSLYSQCLAWFLVQCSG